MNNKIKTIAETLKQTYNTNNPFKICEALNIDVRIQRYNKSFKAFFVKAQEKPIIYVNDLYNNRGQSILCAHELGHILLEHKNVNNFESGNKALEEEANLFALYLLFNEDEFNIKFENMGGFLVKYTLDANIELRNEP